MNYTSIAEVYAANDRIHENLKNTLSGVSDEQANRRTADEKWTIAELVEHIAIVNDGALMLLTKLLAQCSQTKAEDKIEMSPAFLEKAQQAADAKLAAPERVHPSGGKTILESLERMEKSRQAIARLRPQLETLETTGAKFPHPFFGDLTAPEWFAVAGGHEARHTRQIENILRAQE